MASDIAAMSPHEFVGRLDRWCEICNRPDRHPIHQVALGRLSRLESAFQTILEETVLIGNGTAETPARAARAWLEMTQGYAADIPSLVKVFDAEGYDEMIAVTDVPFSSLCEHHLLPFIGVAHVAYLPSNKIIGLSKIPRLIRAFANRLQNQERLTAEIANALTMYLNPNGVLVMCEAEHSCMTLRGACSHGMMRTSVTRGAMREQPSTRDEALRLIGK